MEIASFRSEFVKEYLRYCQRDASVISGSFDFDGRRVLWGAIAEYGDPPSGAILIDLLSGKDVATFRFWHTENGRRGKSVYYGEEWSGLRPTLH